MTEWQPIETAPKDLTDVLILDENIIVAAWFEPVWGYWRDGHDTKYNPTHWMPLPAPPQEGEQ